MKVKMSLYYKRIYEHFNTSNSSKNMNENKECNTAVDSTPICHSGEPSETLLFMNNSKISKRRENKDIQKADDELIMRFVDSLASYSSIIVNIITPIFIYFCFYNNTNIIYINF